MRHNCLPIVALLVLAVSASALAEPPRGFTPSVSELQFQMDTLLAQVQLLDQENYQLQQKIVRMEKQIMALHKRTCDLPKPEKGETGEPGPPGKPGKDAEVDYPQVYEWIAKWIEEHKADLFPEQKLPPITFDILDGEGGVVDSREVYLGGRLPLPAQRVNYLNDSGSPVDTEYVPIGGTLNLHIDVANK